MNEPLSDNPIFIFVVVIVLISTAAIGGAVVVGLMWRGFRYAAGF